MFRNLLIGAALAAVLVCGCSNGWPHTHHLAQPKTAGATCTPSGSHISRQGCGSAQPISSTSQSEYDRDGLGAGGAPMQPPGDLNLPR